MAVLVVTLLVIFAFWEVAVGSRTFTTSVGQPGVSGDDPPPGYGPLDFADGARVDRGASAWQFEPWAEVVHRQVTAGRLPLWNPYQGAGSPLAANMQSAVFDPVLLPVHLHPSPRVWDLTFLAIFAAGGMATYVLGRLLGLGTTASFTGAAAFVLSGFFMVSSNNQYFRVYFYLPVLFALVEVVVRSRGLVPVAGLGVAIALALLAGMPEPSFFALAVSGAFGAYRVLRGPRIAGRAMATIRLGAGAALGLALAAPLLLPFLEYLSVSFNLHDATTGLQADPARRALFWVVPYVNGLPAGTGTRNWVGMAVPMLGAVAVGAQPAMRRHRGWFFLCCATVFLLKQFGADLVQWIGRLPAADRAIFPRFSLPVTAFCLAMLAAIGVQAIEDRLVRRRRLAAGAVLLVLLVLAGVGLDASAITASRARVLIEQFGIAAVGGLLVIVAAAGLPITAAVVAATALVAAEWLVFVPAPATPAAPYRLAVLVCAGVGLLALLVRRHGPRPAALIASVAVVAELLLLVPRGIYPRLWDPFLRPSWLELLGGGPGPASQSHSSQPAEDRVFGLHGKLYPNTAGAFALQDIRTLDALYVRRYVDYIRTFVEPEFDDRFTGRPGDELTPPNLEGNPMWDLLGVRYVLASEAAAVSPFLSRVFAATVQSDSVGPAVVDLGGDRRPALVVHGPQQVAYPIYEKQPQTVSFGYSLLSEAAGSGEKLWIDAVSPAGRTRVWGADVPPGPPSAEAWRAGAADLSRVRGPVTALLLSSEGLAAPAGVAWTGVEVRGPDGSPPPMRLRPAGSAAGVQVREDGARMPRAFLVHRAHRFATQEEAIAYLARAGARFADGAVRVEGFDPASEVVVEAAAGDLPGVVAASDGTIREGRGDARITSYGPDRVVVAATADRPGVLVLTDVFFPGWKATVNGRPARILPADVAFRGVRVGAGRSTVVFTYEPDSFRIGVAIAGLGLAALATMAGFGLVRRRRGKV